jgi:hypothetical protein
METREIRSYRGTIVLAAALAGVGAYVAYANRPPTAERAAAHIASWLDGPRTAAKVMMDRYGPPTVLAPGLAVWKNRGPWKRIAVHGDSLDGYLEQTVGYGAPYSAPAALAGFGYGVRVDPDANELTAAGDAEPLNLLALNLAAEVADGRRTAGEARAFYAKTVRLAASGRSSPYLEGLLFTPYRAAQEDTRRRGIGYY